MTKTPTLSLIIPTQGRPTLERALASARDQLGLGDECWVVVDTHGMSTPEFSAIAERVGKFGPQFWITGRDAGCHDFGHSQVNHGIACARGDYIHVSDDDDVWCPGALAVMREAIVAHPGRVFLFRFRSYLGGTVFWLQPGLVRQACIGGHCLLAPNLPGKLGQWGARYEGDYDAITATLALHDQPPVWVDFIVCEQRPRAEEVAA